MKRALVVITGTIVCLSGAIHAQEEPKSVSPEAIFEDIMQTLPNQVRAQVDSASASSHTQTVRASDVSDQSVSSDSESQSNDDAQARALTSLPESVQQRVEKAIQEIEQSSSERAVQFKEHRQRQKGGK